MTGELALRTERLLLRRWRAEDLAPFAELNADPQVMEWLPSTLAPSESQVLAERITRQMDEQGWGLWALEVPGIADFIGFVGLSSADDTLGYTSVEVGWRLAARHWGHGYATEAARAALDFGFRQLALREVVSFTAVGNLRSRRVMERLGMVHYRDEDFDHPRLASSSPLRRHVLYRVTLAATRGRDTQELSRP